MSWRAKRWVFHAASGVLAAGILLLLLRYQRPAELLRRLSATDPVPLAGAAVLSVGYWLLKSARWRWTAGLEGQRLSLPRACVSMLAGLGVGLLTPFRGGEVVRPMFVPGGVRVRLAGWVVIERLFDLAGVLLLSVLGLLYVVGSGMELVGGRHLSPHLLWACPVLLALALGGPLLVRWRPVRLWVWLTVLLPRWARELAHVHLTGRQFAIFLGTSLVGELLSVLAVFCCLRAFGQIGLVAAVALVPVVMLHNLLPATPGGFGVREGVAVALFGVFGFPQEMVLAGYLTDGVLVLVVPGAVGVVGAWMTGVIAELRRQG